MKREPQHHPVVRLQPCLFAMGKVHHTSCYIAIYGCTLQGAALLSQHAARDTRMDLEGAALRSSYYLAFGATGALLR